MRILVLLSFLLSIFATPVFAQTQTSLSDIMDNLGSQVTFGYIRTTDKISVKEITAQHIVIQSPFITNELGASITKYTVMYSPYPLSDILEKTDLLSQIKEKTVDVVASGSIFTIELSGADSLDPNTKYYISAIPKDSKGTLGEISNELWFKLADQTSGEGTSNATTSALGHGAAGADMSLANISHTIENGKITLTWHAVAGSDTVDIRLKQANADIFDTLTSVPMNNEKYEFVPSRNGDLILSFVPNNGGKEIRYTLTVPVNTVITAANTAGANGVQTKKSLPSVPRTGPTENIAIVLLATFLLYFWYKKVWRKH